MGHQPLPRAQFLAQLQREKRRAERTQRPLSIALYQLEGEEGGDPRTVAALLDLLRSRMRETDSLGYLGEQLIAVLFPDTNEQGVRGFIDKLSAAGTLPVTAVASTYPDQLFSRLARGGRPSGEFDPAFMDEWMRHRTDGYRGKRLLDIVGALVGITLFAPVMLITALGVALTSPGPIVFKQTRLGRSGIPFTFYKFRSMRCNVDDAIHREFVANLIKGDLATAPSGTHANGAKANSIRENGTEANRTEQPLYKIKADPRITRIGRFIRKTSIDELPQFFNVLKGDMSLVGPRPPIPYEAASYKPWHYKRVSAMKPGITGLWQVNGRSKVTFDEMVRMDLRYIRDCSLRLDITLLLKTVRAVMGDSGAV